MYYRYERDSELAAEAQHDELLSESSEPILTDGGNTTLDEF